MRPRRASVPIPSIPLMSEKKTKGMTIILRRFRKMTEMPLKAW